MNFELQLNVANDFKKKTFRTRNTENNPLSRNISSVNKLHKIKQLLYIK